MGMARVNEAINFRRALEIYLKALGHSINDGKSSIFSSIPLSLFKIGLLGSLDFRLVLFPYYTLESLWFWDLSIEYIGRGF